jgi:hypothetical protein
MLTFLGQFRENPAAKGAVDMVCKIIEYTGTNQLFDSSLPYAAKLNQFIKNVHAISLAGVAAQMVSRRYTWIYIARM